MRSKFILMILLMNIFCSGIHAQEIVFPYEFQQDDMIRFSENGEIIGAFKTTGEFHYINSSTSKSLAKITIAEYYQIIQFHVSFSGDYIIFVALRDSKTRVLFYKYEGVNSLKFMNELKLLENPNR